MSQQQQYQQEVQRKKERKKLKILNTTPLQENISILYYIAIPHSNWKNKENPICANTSICYWEVQRYNYGNTN